MGKRKRVKSIYGDDNLTDTSSRKKKRFNQMTGDERVLNYMLEADANQVGHHAGSNRKINYGKTNVSITSNSIEDDEIHFKSTVLDRYQARENALHEYLQDHKDFYKQKYLNKTSQIYVNSGDDVSSIENELPQSLRKEIESYNTHDMSHQPEEDLLMSTMVEDDGESSKTVLEFTKPSDPFHFLVAYAVSNRLKRSPESFATTLLPYFPKGTRIENVLSSRVARDVFFVVRGLTEAQLHPLLRVLKVPGMKKIGFRAPLQHATFSGSTRIAFVSNLDSQSTQILNLKHSLESFTGCPIRWMKHLPHLHSAYIRFKHRFGVEKALSLNGFQFQGWYLRVNEFKDDMNRFN